MPVHHFFPTTNDTGQPDTGLLDALHQWRDAAWTATSECHVPERRAIDANRATVERARDALMRRYGMDPVQAFSLMVRWARQTRTPVHTLARTLVQGLDEADPRPEGRRRPLVRSLEIASTNSPEGSPTMHQRAAQTLRYLARLINHDAARTNAAEGSDTLRSRRRDQEQVDEYLHERHLTSLVGQADKEEPGALAAEDHR